MLQPIEVRKVLINKVTDASGLEELIEKGVFLADDVIGVVGKTEGNGGVNDYTRLLADRAFREVLVTKGTRSSMCGARKRAAVACGQWRTRRHGRTRCRGTCAGRSGR